MYASKTWMNSVIIKMEGWESFFVMTAHNFRIFFSEKGKSLTMSSFLKAYQTAHYTFQYYERRPSFVKKSLCILPLSVFCQYVGYTADPWVEKSSECKIHYRSLCLEIVLASYLSGLHQHCDEKNQSLKRPQMPRCLCCVDEIFNYKMNEAS